VADAIFYQIFPERFRNGDPDNDPTHASLDYPERVPATWRPSSWSADWYARADWEVAAGDDFYDHGVFHRRYGGDLAGVIEKLEYLAGLGINAIYFNPLFYARSMHKYDGNSFHHIDPFFGPDPVGDLELIASETSDAESWHWTSADRLFLELLSEARDRDIRIVMDGVWNHTGRDFFAFADLRRNGELSPYRDWYVVERFDDPLTSENEFDYRGWWGSRSLPEFADAPGGNDLHPGPKEYVFEATRRWMDPDGDGDPSDGIAGWRLDVVPDMPIEFWADWNAHVRSINPDAYTVAEIWLDAGKDVERGGFSGTMNYFAFAMPVKGFLIDDMMTGDAFVRMLKDRMDRYAPANRYGLLNLVDSHDTPRIASMIANRESRYTEPDVFDFDRDSSPRGGRAFDVRKPDARERRIQRMIALLQATHVGPPMIYYGTESGMWGADDPDDRMPMVWDDMNYDVQRTYPSGRAQRADTVAFDRDLYDYYRRIFRVRHERPVLRRGDFEPIGSSDGSQSFAYVRSLGSDRSIVVMNRGDESCTFDIPRPAGWGGVDVVVSTSSDEDIRVTENSATFAVELAPLTAALLENSTVIQSTRDRNE
jgi:glycosidase